MTTTENIRKQIRHAIVTNLKFNEVNVIDLTPKLPKNWYDFKIVETQSGAFTGQISYKKMSKKEIKEWDKVGRIKLAKITKKYLESLLGYKILKFKGKK